MLSIFVYYATLVYDYLAHWVDELTVDETDREIIRKSTSK